MRRLFSVVSGWFVYHGLPIVFLCLLLKNVSLNFNIYFNLDCYSVYKYGEIYVSEQWRNWKQLKDYTTTESNPICLLRCLGDTGSGGAEVDLHHRLLCFRVLLCRHCPHIPGLVEVCATSVNYTMQKTLRRIRICLLSHVGEITTCVAKHLWKIWMLNFLRRNRISFLTKCYKLHQILICFIYYFTDSLNLIWTYLSWIYVWISRSPTYCL